MNQAIIDNIYLWTCPEAYIIYEAIKASAKVAIKHLNFGNTRIYLTFTVDDKESRKDEIK